VEKSKGLGLVGMEDRDEEPQEEMVWCGHFIIVADSSQVAPGEERLLPAPPEHHSPPTSETIKKVQERIEAIKARAAGEKI